MSAAERMHQHRERMRQHRARVRAGRRVIQLEIDDTALPAALVVAGLLDPRQADDAEAVAGAIERLLATLAQDVGP